MMVFAFVLYFCGKVTLFFAIGKPFAAKKIIGRFQSVDCHAKAFVVIPKTVTRPETDFYVLQPAKHRNSLTRWAECQENSNSQKNAVRRDLWKSTALRVEKDSFLTRKAVLCHLQSGALLFEGISL
ncbi:MAG: hypothetical protein K6G08_07225 [Prevotella sp.]|nr:hypothetical protein [Prevotella sp.]